MNSTQDTSETPDIVIGEESQVKVTSEEPDVKPVQEQVSQSSSEMEERKPQNTMIDFPVSEKSEAPLDEAIALPSDTNARTMEFARGIPNIEIGGTKVGKEWAATIQDSLGMNSFGDTFLPSLEDEKANFLQYVGYNNAKVQAGNAIFNKTPDSVFEGEVAVLRTMSHLGLGSSWHTPLYNTGMWVMFKPPTEEALVELYRLLTSDQIVLGRYSYGLIYSSTTAFVLERMCRFAVSHIYRINAKSEEISAENILTKLKATDINSLLWGMACTMYPNGFDYRRACTADAVKCQHVVVEKLNLRRLQFTNNDALSERNRAHMVMHRTKSILSNADLLAYEKEMIRTQGHSIKVYEGTPRAITFHLTVPSIQEYLDASHRWIDEMVNSVEKALGSDSSYEERNRLVDLRHRATIMRQWSHWVGSIETGSEHTGDRTTINDRATIENVIGSVSGDKTIREKFLTGVRKYIENISVSVIGIPTYDCPACKKANEGPETFPHRTHLIPIDVAQLFFALLTQKHADLQRR